MSIERASPGTGIGAEPPGAPGGLPGRPSLANVLAATPTMISTINAVLTGVIAALVVFEVLFDVDFVVPAAAAAGCAVFVLALIIQLRWARTQIQRQQATMHAIFPSASQPERAQVAATVKES